MGIKSLSRAWEQKSSTTRSAPSPSLALAGRGQTLALLWEGCCYPSTAFCWGMQRAGKGVPFPLLAPELPPTAVLKSLRFCVVMPWTSSGIFLQQSTENSAALSNLTEIAFLKYLIFWFTFFKRAWCADNSFFNYAIKMLQINHLYFFAIPDFGSFSSCWF